jgi:hypothetical protein
MSIATKKSYAAATRLFAEWLTPRRSLVSIVLPKDKKESCVGSTFSKARRSEGLGRGFALSSIRLLIGEPLANNARNRRNRSLGIGDIERRALVLPKIKLGKGRNCEADSGRGGCSAVPCATSRLTPQAM